MTALSSLPPTLRSYLGDFVVKARRAAVVRGIGIAAARFLGWMILACVADRFLHLPQSIRLGLLIAGAGLALAAALPPLLSLRRRVDWVSAAWEVERHNPAFGQRLVTVTSRFLGAADYRGSDEILLRLAREVDSELAADRTAVRPPVRNVLAPWAIVSLELLLIAGLARLPDLGFARLADRFVLPMSGVPPVTTTQLSVSPGDADVIQSRPLTIQVRAERLADSPVMLYLGDGVHEWWRSAMMPAGSGTFTFTLASVDKDLRYHVAGGDAVTPDYSIRALRKPAVSQFTVRYEYPPYTRLPPLTVTNTDGRIEAPAGTRVQLTVTATEPLQSALLTIGKDKILMDRTPDPRVRRAELVVRGESHYDLDLISARDVAGSGPTATMYLRAVPDVPPQVRLSRGGESLRLTPRDMLPLSYEALDDYGVQSLVVHVQINAKETEPITVSLWGDPRRRQDVFNLDLATLPLGIGDVLTVSLAGTDTAGHAVSSEPLHVLISPRAVDLDSYERIGELGSATQLAGTLLAQFEDANRAQDEAAQQKDRQSSGYLSVSSRGDRALSAAAQTAVLLRQSLLRAITHSDSPQLSVALADWVDAAERENASADEAFRQSGAPDGMANTGRDLVRRAVDQARELRTQLQAVHDGQQAADVLRDRDNLRAAEARPAPADANARNRLNQTLQRMREEIARDVRQLGLDPGAADLDTQLHAKSSAADALVQNARPVDFASAAKEWSRQIQADARQRLGLEGRLSAAAQAEAIRRDADLIRARDLDLEARAAGAIAASLRGGAKPIAPKTFDDFPEDVQKLQHLLEIQSAPKPGGKESDELKSARAAASAARQDLLRDTGDSDALASASTRGATASDRQKEAEDLALQASAAAATHDYKQAAAIDQSMIKRLEEKPRRESTSTRASTGAVDETEPAVAISDRLEHHRRAVQHEMASAQKIDAIGQSQEQLVAASAGDALAGKQRAVAEQIAQVARQSSEESAWSSAPNARDKAAAEVLAAQEQLAGMPRAMADAQSAAARRRDAAARAAAARQQAHAAAPDQRAAADRAAAQAEQDAKDAADRVTRMTDPVSSRAARSMADRLMAFAPETSAACAVLSDQLAPSLQAFEHALSGDDAGANDRFASDARHAIESAQRELAAVQDDLVKRDPLVAAKWFARAAAESLSLRPPDLGRARQRQADVSAALSRAWDQSIHRAAADRLAALPSLASVMGPPAAPPRISGQTPTADRFPAAREWGRLRAAEGPELNAPLHDTDPPGYEEALRLYFEALGKAQEGK